MQLQAFKVDLSSSLKPMMELLSTNKSFIWTEAQDSAFQRTKDLLCSKMSLDYYDPSRPTLLMTDASNLGIGAAVVQRCPVTGKYSIIMCRSRTLSPAETRYSVSEKELLAAVFGMKKHQQQLIYTANIGEKFRYSLSFCFFTASTFKTVLSHLS